MTMMILLLIFTKSNKMYRVITRTYGYMLFRIFNIIMFPTFVISFLVFEMEHLGLIQYEIFIMTIYIASFLTIICIYSLQVKSIFKSIFMPSNSIILTTTLIDNKHELSARVYQVILASRKLIFAFLIVY